jgi:hypothetical protein
MTKALHNGLGQIQRLLLWHLKARALDTIQLTAKVYGVAAEAKANGSWDMTHAQHASVRRALNNLQRKGKVGSVGRNRHGRQQWMLAERLPSCNVCHQHLKRGDDLYILDNAEVHVICWIKQNRGKTPPETRYTW